MDGFVLLAVIIIPVISLLVFVGCGLTTTGGPQPTTGPFDVPSRCASTATTSEPASQRSSWSSQPMSVT